VLGHNQALLNRAFVSSIKLASHVFSPEALCQNYASVAGGSETYDWNVDPFVMEIFRPQTVEDSAGVTAANQQ
jgi:hypothetical protein